MLLAPTALAAILISAISRRLATFHSALWGTYRTTILPMLLANLPVRRRLPSGTATAGAIPLDRARGTDWAGVRPAALVLLENLLAAVPLLLWHLPTVMPLEQTLRVRHAQEEAGLMPARPEPPVPRRLRDPVQWTGGWPEQRAQSQSREESSTD